jgi:hypothetical protein
MVEEEEVSYNEDFENAGAIEQSAAAGSSPIKLEPYLLESSPRDGGGAEGPNNTSIDSQQPPL